MLAHYSPARPPFTLASALTSSTVSPVLVPKSLSHLHSLRSTSSVLQRGAVHCERDKKTRPRYLTVSRLAVICTLPERRTLRRTPTGSAVIPSRTSLPTNTRASRAGRTTCRAFLSAGQALPLAFTLFVGVLFSLLLAMLIAVMLQLLTVLRELSKALTDIVAASRAVSSCTADLTKCAASVESLANVISSDLEATKKAIRFEGLNTKVQDGINEIPNALFAKLAAIAASAAAGAAAIFSIIF